MPPQQQQQQKSRLNISAFHKFVKIGDSNT